MTATEIVRAAYNGVVLDGMRMPEKLLYERTKNICMRYGLGILPPETATEMKLEAMREYKRDATLYDGLIETQTRSARLWADIELLSSAYIKDRTLENADALVKRLYGQI